MGYIDDYTYETNDYIYGYSPNREGWFVDSVKDRTKSEYENILSHIAFQGVSKPVVYMGDTFEGCTELVRTPAIPDTITEQLAIFSGCTKLKYIENIPKNLSSMFRMFENCTSLEIPPTIPEGVTNLGRCFSGCKALKEAPNLPQTAENLYESFLGTAINEPPIIPNGVDNMGGTFKKCTLLEQPPIIPESVTFMRECFYGCTRLAYAPVLPNELGSMYRCFTNCNSLVEAPEIPSSVTQMGECFSGCINLEGNIVVNNTPVGSYYSPLTDVFKKTQKDIFIVNKGNGESTWRNIASQYINVHYEADDNPTPSVTAFTVTRVSGSGQTEYSARGEWAHIQATVNVSTAAIPVGWTNSLKSVTLKKDGTVITPTWTPSSPTSFPAVMETWVNTGDLGTHSFSIQIADSVKNNGTEVRSTSSAELTISLLKVYTLVDYYHDQTTGTEGIAFGKYAEAADLFEVDMETKFDQGLTAIDDIITTKNLKGENALLELDTTATSGSDKEIYDALVSLGWTDCIV